MTMTVQELITWLNAEKGRKYKFSKLMGKNTAYARYLCNGIAVKSLDMELAERCVKQLQQQENTPISTYRLDTFRTLCSKRGFSSQFARYAGVSRQSISMRLRNKQSINDEQWCMIESFAREHGYGL